MYSYIEGLIVEIYVDAIVLENHEIGYHIYVPNPYSFEKNKTHKVYIYQSVSENDIRLYGFNSFEQKDLFLKLIKVKGIGPKSAVAILAVGNVNEIIEAIENGNVKFLKSFPGIGPKAASQIILDLKGKFENVTITEVDENYQEAIEVLIALGYKENDVDKVMKSLKQENYDTNTYVKQALRLMTQK